MHNNGIDKNLQSYSSSELNKYNDVDYDEDVIKKHYQRRKHEIEELKHNIAKNIYDFLLLMTHKATLITIVSLFIFAVYPLSKLDMLPYSINIYLKNIVSVLQNFLYFILGAIITDWASNKYR